MPKKSRNVTRPTVKKPAAKKPTPNSAQVTPKSLPTPVSLVKQVWHLYALHRRLFLRFVGAFWLVSFIAVGFAQQAEYADLSAATGEAVSTIAGGAAQNLAAIGILLSSVVTGSLTLSLSETQSLTKTALLFLLLLSTVWLVRHLHAGATVSVRDALYNGAAPAVSSIAVAAIGILQLVPLALVATLFATIANTGALNNLALTVLLLSILLILSVATLYWLTSTVIALFVVTIPGTYPWAAMKTSQGLVKGLRLKILGRILWLVVASVLAVVVGLLPLVLLDVLVGADVSYLLAACIEALTVGVATISVTYLYMLYRGVLHVRAD